MGKVLGIISLVFGLVSLVLTLLYYLIDTLGFLNILFVYLAAGLAGAGIICGVIGISKDDKPGLAIAGLVISSISMVIFIVRFVSHFF